MEVCGLRFVAVFVLYDWVGLRFWACFAAGLWVGWLGLVSSLCWLVVSVLLSFMFLVMVSCGGVIVGCMVYFMVADCGWVLWVVTLVNSVG